MKKYLASLSALLMLILLSQNIFARDVKDVSLDVTVTGSGSEAKQQAFDKATEEVTFQAVQEIIGPEKGLKIWPQVKSKILKNSARYILFIRSSQSKTVSTGLQMSVSLRISHIALESLLRDEGVLSGAQDGSVRVLPVVSFSDTTGSLYAWWADLGENSTSVSLSRDLFQRFQNQLSNQFKGKSIYMFDPTQASFRASVPESLRIESLRREDQGVLAQYFKADVVLSGTVRLIKLRPDSAQLRLDYDLQAWQSRTGRLLVEVQRSVDLVQGESSKVTLQQAEVTSIKIIDEMVARVSEANASGALNLSIVRLTVNGNLSYAQMENFKKSLLDQVRELRSLKDRLYEPSRVSFEVDSQVPATDLAKVFGKFKSAQFDLEVREANAQSVNISVRAR